MHYANIHFQYIHLTSIKYICRVLINQDAYVCYNQCFHSNKVLQQISAHLIANSSIVVPIIPDWKPTLDVVMRPGIIADMLDAD